MARDERGAAALEFVVIVPALLLLIGLVVGGGRVWYARTTVHQLADSAARTASLARTASEAQAGAVALAGQDAEASGLSCEGGPGVAVDTAGFAVPVGQPASVRTSVRCSVPLADLLVPGWPGTLDVEASAESVLDRYRGRR